MNNLEEHRKFFNPSSDSVTRLRAKTGCGFYPCKDALKYCLGDEEEAVEYLRRAGTTVFDSYLQELTIRQEKGLRWRESLLQMYREEVLQLREENAKLREEKQKFIDTLRSIPKRPQYYPEVLLDVELGEE